MRIPFEVAAGLSTIIPVEVAAIGAPEVTPDAVVAAEFGGVARAVFSLLAKSFFMASVEWML
jgi:hypothetical protein